MKCPKCKKEMVKLVSLARDDEIECCNNKKCWFYGIERYASEVKEAKER